MNLCDPAQMRAFLKKHGLSPNKGLGQHFLCSQEVVDAIVAAASQLRSIVEIGPGPGVLTGPLSQSAKLVAFELDPAMVPLLAESAPNAFVLRADALKADMGGVLADLPAPRGIVSNLPYYITGPLLERVESVADRIDLAVLMMQKEVAERIVAEAGDADRGALSVLLQYRFEIDKLCSVPADAFLPAPKVDSMVVQFRPRAVTVDDAFKKLVRAGFRQPRKTLANNLMAAYPQLGKPRIEEIIRGVGLLSSVRPHALGQKSWLELFARLGR